MLDIGQHNSWTKKISIVREVTPTRLEENFIKIKEEVRELVESEFRRIESCQVLEKFVVK
jgi:hypothetical protein